MTRSLSLLALLFLLVSSLVLVSGHSDASPLSLIHLDVIESRLDAGGSISIDADVLRGMGERVNITFSGLSSHYPGNNDWIGVWSPKPMNYSHTAPSKYHYVTPDQNGSGHVEWLWLLNMRDEVMVAYFSGGLERPILLAESPPVPFENYAQPMHIHLALTNDPTQMRVDWTSNQDGNNHQQWVRWGERNLSQLIKQVTTTTYTAADMCGAPATTVGYRNPGWLHTALIEGLRPNTHYYYQVGDDSSPNAESSILEFWSAPTSDAENVEFVIFGDLGQVETDGSFEPSEMNGSIFTSTALTYEIQQQGKGSMLNLSASAAVFHIGDISYARGYVSIWEQFFHQISRITPFLPWMTVDGNHERDWPKSGSVYNGTDSGGECGVALAQRFHMPSSPSSSSVNDTTWWSLDFGPVHFTVMSTEHAFDPSSLQYDWIARDLASVDRSKTPFLIFAGHRPMYDDGPVGAGNPLMDSVEPLLIKYKVDVVFWGHVHNYQRTCPIHNYTCVGENEAPIQIITGAAGAGFSQAILDPQPKWIRFVNDSTYGYVIAHVKGRKTLTLDFIHAAERSVMDTVTINSKFQQQWINHHHIDNE